MSNKVIYRIEHKDFKKGFFTTGFIPQFSFDSELLIRAGKLPTPIEEGKLRRFFNYPRHFCAFSSREQVLQWVRNEWIEEMLLVHDFRLLKLKVSECFEGDHQVIFYRKHIMNKVDLTEVFLREKDVLKIP